MAGIDTLCVYCGSSNAVDAKHLTAAADLGRAAAMRGIRLVFGGGRVGLMGALADGALAAGGVVVGVIPEHLRAREVAHEGVQDMLVVESMHARKQRMFDLSDAFCILPGGFGTLDETFEIVTWKQLGLHAKPVILVNIEGFWTPLIEMIEHQSAAGFVRPGHTGLLRVVERVSTVFDVLERAPERPQGSLNKDSR